MQRGEVCGLHFAENHVECARANQLVHVGRITGQAVESADEIYERTLHSFVMGHGMVWPLVRNDAVHKPSLSVVVGWHCYAFGSLHHYLRFFG